MIWELITHLGDYWFVTIVAIAIWLGYERDRGPWPVVVVLGAIGLVTLLKMTFAVPRPPGAEIDGYAFPSGHALGATVAYGLLALEIGTRRAGLAAIAVITIVASSRVALGVHYPIDVAVGVGVGLAYLAVALAMVGRLKMADVRTDLAVLNGGIRE
ncbi:phosphatase PAP2 family protein [Natronoglomus mannanivorans]|uniref:Phosphatase PAP2 family protein n=1 Tax=Natronoglomus mannanivorans TaxID=2979990 RepID=A0AAP2YXE8_9EURY|nr:phosphatase PAP2 family protein [Halobacteria archaeon AArc-xg1-1]